MKEEWRDIPDFPGCEASNLGRIKGVSGKVLKPGSTKTGYFLVTVWGKCKSVHSLVAEAFIGPKPYNREVDHIDHDKLNNTPSNLRYISHARNQWRKPLREKVAKPPPPTPYFRRRKSFIEVWQAL